MLVTRHRVHADHRQVVAGGRQANRLRSHGHTGLEALRGGGEGRALDPDDLDHRATGEERRQRGEQLAPPVEHADAERAEHLVAAEDGEVHSERMHVDGHVRHRLGRVEHHQRADLASASDKRSDWVDRAEHVGLVGEREHLGALGDHLVEVGQVETALRCDGEPAQGRAGALAQLLKLLARLLA